MNGRQTNHIHVRHCCIYKSCVVWVCVGLGGCVGVCVGGREKEGMRERERGKKEKEEDKKKTTKTKRTRMVLLSQSLQLFHEPFRRCNVHFVVHFFLFRLRAFL